MFFAASLAFAQRGDVKGEEQPPLPEALHKPPPRPLTPEEELATFRVERGLRVELVAAEPLVQSPVCAAFDERGRLFVCEMTSYMRDADGTDEGRADGVVAVLIDTDGDGRMDERQVFLDGLVLPRAVAPTRGGALVITPPHLLFARDDDGDGRADHVRVLDTGLQGLASPEHAINGLYYALDNWFWCANAPVRYRWNGEQLERGRTAGGGQWGIAEDARGRLYFNDNSNPLRCDLYPSHYAARNPSLGVAPGMNVNIAQGTKPSPAHTTPGVNRGYRDGLLVEGRLAQFTGACAPLIFEGDGLRDEHRGDAFVAEPCGNLVHRFELALENSRPRATTAPPDGAFLASTDERFRPVHLFEGPDGALYVADMYRGVIQHKLFVTSWLREQIEERELETPIQGGRIWRVTAREKPVQRVDLANASWSDLASALDSRDRWTRKTAQRLLVEDAELAPGVADREALDALREHARGGESELGRLHALWALDGLGHAEPELARMLWWGESGSDPINGARLIERRLLEGGDEALEWWMNRVRFAPLEQKRAAALAIGSMESAASLRALAFLAESCATDDVSCGALVAALGGRELEFMAELAKREAAWDRTRVLKRVATSIVRERRPQRVGAMLELLAFGVLGDSEVEAAASGALDGCAKNADGSRRPIRLASAPAKFVEFAAREGASAAVVELANLLAWPGKPGVEFEWPRELTEQERSLASRGRAVFEQVCASCHQLGGQGDPATAPPLRDSPWVLGDADVLVRIVAHGLRGPLTFGDLTWDGEMPAHELSDDELAGVLTFLRREWGHGADPVAPAFVREVRSKYADRRAAWSVDELRAQK